MIHLPNQIRQFGAPRYAWCFRFESKNAPFKKIMRRNCNFLNVPWSLSTHHQKLVGLDIRTDGEGKYFGVSDNIEVILTENHKHKTVLNCRFSNLICNSTPLNLNSKIRIVKRFKMSGRICSVGTVFLRKLAEDVEGFPVFFRVAEVIMSEFGVYVVMENIVTIFFCRDRFAFIVQPQQTFDSCLNYSAFKFVTPLHSTTYEGHLHVFPNYYDIV